MNKWKSAIFFEQNDNASAVLVDNHGEEVEWTLEQCFMLRDGQIWEYENGECNPVFDDNVAKKMVWYELDYQKKGELIRHEESVKEFWNACDHEKVKIIPVGGSYKMATKDEE